MKKLTAFLFYFLFFAANAAFMPYIVLYYQSLGFNGAQIGLLASLSPLLAMVGAPFWTGLADATRRHRLIMSVALGVSIIGGVILPMLRTFLPMVLLAVVYSFFFSSINSLADSGTMAMLEGRQELYGRLRLGGTIGWGLSAPLVGLLVEDHGLRVAFWCFSAIMFLALLVSQNLRFKRAETSHHSLLSGARILLANRRYVLFLVMALTCGIGFASVNNYLFPYMEELHASRGQMGLALTLSTLSELPVLLFSNRFVKKIKPHGLLVLGMGVTALRLLLYAAASAPLGVLVFQLLNGFTFSLVWVAGVSYADQSAPPGMSASAQGLFGAMVFGFGSAIGGFTGSLLLEALGGRMMFLVFGLFLLLSLGVLTWLERKCPPVARKLGVCE